MEGVPVRTFFARRYALDDRERPRQVGERDAAFFFRRALSV